ncbi:LysR family transcriptional regulator [Kordiimonas pumila]|uniref:LysR family transcriptional regulator n=1 Tax=Kordiimonas pumila TaxID=2161677 RepID=A0ABV7D8W8_9PROT|nr:LysR family transcriptional regulator [Kordiimonas pumila]
MDNRAGEMAVFVAAVENGGFSAAGRKLGMSPSAISKLVMRTEDRLGTPLLVRSTRNLQLTPEGALYMESARRILAQIEDAERLISTGKTAVPRGKLRVSTTVAFGERCLLPLVPKFLELYPKIELDISLIDSVIDLIDERTDIAVRSGPLRNSSLMARKLMEGGRVIVASPAYLEAHGTPQTPAALHNHNCLQFNFRRSMDEWPFRDPATGNTFSLPVPGTVFANNGIILNQLCRKDLGLVRLGRFHVEDDIKAGRLVPVLENYNPDDKEIIHAVYVGHEHLALRIRAFIDFLVDNIKYP